MHSIDGSFFRVGRLFLLLFLHAAEATLGGPIQPSRAAEG